MISHSLINVICDTAEVLKYSKINVKYYEHAIKFYMFLVLF